MLVFSLATDVLSEFCSVRITILFVKEIIRILGSEKLIFLTISINLVGFVGRMLVIIVRNLSKLTQSIG